MPAAADREAAARETILRAFDEVCPNIHGNPFIPHWPHPPQQLFLGLHLHRRPGQPSRVMQALYGGAAGGGKSDALLMSLAQFAWKHGEFQGIAFRRTFADLALPGALMDRALSWWKPRGVHWSGETKTFTFPSGARVTFAYLEHATDHLRYQGAEFHQTCWDELTQFPLESQYDYVGLSRVRRREGCPIPMRTLAATNPGGPGHAWVQKRFVGGMDPITGAPLHPEGLFVPARIQDNPSLDRDSYIEGLQRLHPTVRAQLLAGDWYARDPGDYFRREWFGDMLTLDQVQAVHGGQWIRWWDLAASEKQDAARTAGVQMVRLPRGLRVVTHAVAFRATPGTRDDRIVQQAKIDGFGCTVGIEIEGGSGGVAQFESLAARLKAAGYRAVGVRPRAPMTDREQKVMLRNPVSDTGKAARADPVASCLERGYQRRGECADTGGPWWGLDAGLTLGDERDGIRLVAGPWTQEYLDELTGFPDSATVDLVDATSGAWAWLEAHPAGLRVPIEPKQQKPDLSESHNASLDERWESIGDAGRDPRGRWRP